MVLLKLVMQDVRGGIAKMWPGFLFSFLLFNFFFFMLYIRVLSNSPTSLPLNFEDYVVCIIAGIPTYVFDPSNPFKIPAQWLLSCLLVSYFTLCYPCRDLSGMGLLVIISSKSRWLWWLSKCVWIALCVAAFYGTGIMAAAFFTVLTGGGFVGGVSSLALVALGFNETSLLYPPSDTTKTVVVSIISMVAICHVQMALAIATKPIIGFMGTASILFMSAFIQSPYLLGNYLMAARSDMFVLGGLVSDQGMLLAIATSVVSITFGNLYFRRVDIVGSEN